MSVSPHGHRSHPINYLAQIDPSLMSSNLDSNLDSSMEDSVLKLPNRSTLPPEQRPPSTAPIANNTSSQITERLNEINNSILKLGSVTANVSSKLDTVVERMSELERSNRVQDDAMFELIRRVEVLESRPVPVETGQGAGNGAVVPGWEPRPTGSGT